MDSSAERQDPVLELDVLLHLVPFLEPQRSRLLQDRVGNADLADVVEQAGKPQPLETLAVDPEGLADRDGELGDRLGVAARPGVLCVDRPRERRSQGPLMMRGRLVLGLAGRGQARVIGQRVQLRPLGLVQGDVGLVDQEVPCLRSRRFGQADAERPLPDRLAREPVDLVCERKRVPVAAPWEQDHELVAACAVDRSFAPGRRAGDVADALDVPIAGLMPLRVVDLLETVEVERHQREDGAALGSPHDFERQIVVKGAMVPEPRQIIGTGLDLEAHELGVARAGARSAAASQHEHSTEERRKTDDKRRECLSEVEKRQPRSSDDGVLTLPEGCGRIRLNRRQLGPRLPSGFDLSGSRAPADRAHGMTCRHPIGDGERGGAVSVRSARASAQIVEQSLPAPAQRGDVGFARPSTTRRSQQPPLARDDLDDSGVGAGLPTMRRLRPAIENPGDGGERRRSSDRECRNTDGDSNPRHTVQGGFHLHAHRSRGRLSLHVTPVRRFTGMLPGWRSQQPSPGATAPLRST